MAQDEAPTRATALKALKAREIDFFIDPDDELYVWIMPLDEKLAGPECIALPEVLSSKTVRYLWWHYRIPIHWFWNPLMIPGAEDNKPLC